MADDLDDLVDWAEPFLERMAPGELKKLNRSIANGLRQNARSRIAAQEAPDGTPYSPRVAKTNGRIRRKAMFRKLRQNGRFRTDAGTDYAAIGWRGKNASIARIHQYGKRGRVTKDGPWYDYPERRLLGFSRDDREFLRDQVEDHLMGE